MSNNLPENDGELIEDIYDDQDSNDQFDISAIGEAYANQKTYPSVNPYTGQPDTSGVTPYTGQPDISGITPVNNNSVANQDAVTDTADRTPQQYVVDTSQNGGTPGSPIVNPSIDEEDPLPRTRIVTYTSYYEMEITDYSPAALASLQSQGYKAIAIYDDGTEAEVPWSEVRDLSPAAEYILTEIEAMTLANDQHFWTRTENPDGAGAGAFVTDDEQDAFLYSAQNNFADQGDASETIEQTETFTSDGLTTRYDLYYEAVSTNYLVEVDGQDVNSGITKSTTHFVFDEAPADNAAISVTYDVSAKPWHNLLLNSYGLALRQGLKTLAAFTKSAVTFFDGDGNQSSNINAYFGSDGSRIGKDDESHIQLDYHSLQLIDLEGNRYLHVSDLRDHDGKGPLITETCEISGLTSDGTQRIYPTTYAFYAENGVVAIESVTQNGVALDSSQYEVGVSSTGLPMGIRVYAASASYSSTITVTYYSAGEELKAFTFGNRRAGGIIGTYSASFGRDSVASEHYSFVEGSYTTASGRFSHAEGIGATASGGGSHAEGYSTTASGDCSHAEGHLTKASGPYSHTEGYDTTASGDHSHAEGYKTTASGQYSHAEGHSTTASGLYSHAEGYNDVVASGDYSHAEGYYNKAIGTSSHAEGYGNQASGARSHAEGTQNVASGQYSHAEGGWTEASMKGAHAEGFSTEASGEYSHAEGYNAVASGYDSHAEGIGTTASGQSSHAEGWASTASGLYSHAEGDHTEASGQSSHTSGSYTKATAENQFVIGKYNAVDASSLFIVGNGSSDSSRSNLFTVGSSSITANVEIAANNGISWKANTNIACPATANSQEWSIDLNGGSYTGAYFHVWSGKNSKSILRCNNDDNSVEIANGPLTCGNRITASNGNTWTNGFVVRDTRMQLEHSFSTQSDSAGFFISPDLTAVPFIGRMFVREYTNNVRALTLETSRTINGTRYYNGIGIGLDSSGKRTYSVSDSAAFRSAIGAFATTGGTISGDLVFDSNSDDSPDIVFKYANDKEKSRIWTDNTYSSAIGPNYRVYNSSGTSLYSGRLATIAEAANASFLSSGTVAMARTYVYSAAITRSSGNSGSIDMRVAGKTVYIRIVSYHADSTGRIQIGTIPSGYRPPYEAYGIANSTPDGDYILGESDGRLLVQYNGTGSWIYGFLMYNIA